jgi:hypothetical protein
MSFSNDIPSLQNQLAVSVEFSEDLKELREDINNVYQNIASAVNNKIGGLYVPQEKISSQQYFLSTNVQKYRNVYRMTVDFGTLPNAGTKSVPHNIQGWNSNFRLTCMYGGATDPINLKALPVPNDGISLSMDQNNVTITTTIDLSTFTACTIVIEYTKEA